jgi:hypothetical protein
MAEDPFEKARRQMERAQREFHKRMQRAHEELHRATGEAQKRIAEARGEFDKRMAALRELMRQAGMRPPPGLGKLPRGGSSGNRKPRRPDPDGWTPSGPGRGGPQPTPVRPNNPSFLSGGAEAPLDE